MVFESSITRFRAFYKDKKIFDISRQRGSLVIFPNDLFSTKKVCYITFLKTKGSICQKFKFSIIFIFTAAKPRNGSTNHISDSDQKQTVHSFTYRRQIN